MFKKILNNYLFVLVALNYSIAACFAESIEVSLIYIGDIQHNAYLGAKQGLKEANLQGQFLNQKYTLDYIAADAALDTNYTDHIALVTAVDRQTFQKLTKALPNVPIFNLTLADDTLRLECQANALHITPSERMKADAVQQWLKKTPGSNAVAQAWHPDFKKFAARDLNKRFLKAHKTKMDDAAWAGWAAVKIISDTVARENITNSAKLLSYLKTELSFDGQKGIDMNFRATGQLRQPILLIEDDKIVTEAPIRGVAKPPTVDSLGLVECPK